MHISDVASALYNHSIFPPICSCSVIQAQQESDGPCLLVVIYLCSTAIVYQWHISYHDFKWFTCDYVGLFFTCLLFFESWALEEKIINHKNMIGYRFGEQRYFIYFSLKTTFTLNDTIGESGESWNTGYILVLFNEIRKEMWWYRLSGTHLNWVVWLLRLRG